MYWRVVKNKLSYRLLYKKISLSSWPWLTLIRSLWCRSISIQTLLMAITSEGVFFLWRVGFGVWKEVPVWLCFQLKARSVPFRGTGRDRKHLLLHLFYCWILFQFSEMRNQDFSFFNSLHCSFLAFWQLQTPLLFAGNSEIYVNHSSSVGGLQLRL